MNSFDDKNLVMKYIRLGTTIEGIMQQESYKYTIIISRHFHQRTGEGRGTDTGTYHTSYNS